MTKIRNKKIPAGGVFVLALFVIFAFWSVPALRAYEIKNVNAGDKGDFILQPAKVEVSLDPGTSVTKNLDIINRLGETRDFKIEIEDFTGSKTGQRAAVLLGDEKGPYSLRDYIKPEVTEFTLKQGQKITLPITISIPDDGEPGGRYGSILVSTTPPEKGADEGEGAGGGTKIISRLGALFFVRVNGPALEEGSLKDFKASPAKKIFHEKDGPSGFDLVFENKGNVHLNPYGTINVSNTLGMTVAEIEVQPYFAMPGSLRQRHLDWGGKTLLGRYTATAQINRGYGNIVDEKSITFWVLPWKILLGGFGIIFFIVFVVRWFFSKFELKKKS